MDDATRTALEEMPPSAKLVYKTLEYEGPLTQGELATDSVLPSRTVRYALTTLTDEGLIEERLHIQDARKRLYSLPTEEPSSSSADIAVNEPR